MLFNLAISPSLQTDYRFLVRALLVSILLHLLLLLLVPIAKHLDEKEPLEITLLEVPREQRRQIVQPTEAPKQDPPKETKRLSDTSQTAMEEQIRRGSGGSPPPATASKAIKKQISKPAEQKKVATRKSPSLRLKPQQVLASIETSQISEAEEAKQAQKAASLVLPNEYQPFRSRSLNSLLKGKAGTPDYLPKVKDGDITLLNAKAYKYAVFVRRVATKVFGALQRKSWQTLPRSSILRIRTPAVFQAVLSPEGKLLRVTKVTDSGSEQFDIILDEAVNDGAWDKNPPPGAASPDGNIRFVFQAKSWSRGSPRGPFEQRWILLGTGLL